MARHNDPYHAPNAPIDEPRAEGVAEAEAALHYVTSLIASHDVETLFADYQELLAYRAKYGAL